MSKEEEDQQVENMRPRQLGNKTAIKRNRIRMDAWQSASNTYKGGTRKVYIKNATKGDLIKEEIKLFFSNGESPKKKHQLFQS